MNSLPVRRKPKSSNKKQQKRKYGSRDADFLTPETRQILYHAIEAGMPARKAADLAGIDKRKFDEWMLRGKKTDSRYSRKCYYFRKKVKELEKKRELEALESIRAMGNGGFVVVETKIKKIDGEEVESITTTKEMAPKWQASAWFLERRCKDYTLDQTDDKTPEERAKQINELVNQMAKTIPGNPSFYTNGYNGHSSDD